MKQSVMRSLVLGVVTILVLGSGGCTPDIYQATFEEAASINQNSNLGLEYLRSSPSEKAEETYNPDQPEIASSEDLMVIGYYFKYPWNSQHIRLRQIRVSGGDHDLFGIKVLDDITTVEPIMTQQGYTKAEIPGYYQGTASEIYTKYHVYIGFETDSDSTLIQSILVSLRDPSEPVIAE